MNVGFVSLGLLPPEIGRLQSLVYLSLNKNKLFGSIPSEIGNMTGLQILHLAGNSLTGVIPSEIFSLHSIQSIDFGENQLSGTLLLHFCSCSCLILSSLTCHPSVLSLQACYRLLSGLAKLLPTCC